MDTIIDAVFIVADVTEIIANPYNPYSWASLGADFACFFIPGATGGGLGVRSLKGASKVGKKTTINPFQGKTPAEINEMFKAKGYEVRGNDPVNGYGGYVNPKTGRSYHIDPRNSFGEPPHVDVNRLRTYKGPLGKKNFFY